jgi:hypothetical protein
MIAHDSRGTPENARSLSEAVTRRVREAIHTRASSSTTDIDGADVALAAALEEAAAEAHARALHPEELLLAIKALEEQVALARGTVAYAERRALRARLVTACIHAYFRDR